MPDLPPRDGLHTTAQAAIALNVPQGRIRRWKLDGKVAAAGLVPAAVPGGEQPLYYLAELEHLAAAYHRRHAAQTVGR